MKYIKAQDKKTKQWLYVEFEPGYHRINKIKFVPLKKDASFISMGDGLLDKAQRGEINFVLYQMGFRGDDLILHDFEKPEMSIYDSMTKEQKKQYNEELRILKKFKLA